MSALPSPASTDTVLAERRAQLESERAHLLDQAGMTLADVDDVDPEDPTKGRDAVRAALASMTRTALDDIDDALARLAAGTYGRCQSCDRDIPVERLEVMPATRFCVACRQRSE